ncbi:MAG: indole-3-glycerol phosphate synthase TrpC [Candidatus Omnitrophica bacterium]|nr:indole-3-glycerol phosphate synthase TrpC [Candidatus Omnitrophota bacterium]
MALNVLEDILAHKRQEVAAAKQRCAPAELEKRLRAHEPTRSFRAAIRKPGRVALIAELKRKSPSKGMLRERFDPVSLAQELQDAGAAALSVLTDERYFGGHLEFLRDVQAFTEIPVLRKDFVIDAYQVYEAAYYQADAALLIVRILDDAVLAECLETAHVLGLDALVEVHGEEDLTRALAAGARIIGINHRDLQSFTMDHELSARLAPQIPKDKIIVAESGVTSPDDIQRLRDLGVHAILVGEALMTAPDPALKLRELLQQTT